MAGSAVLTDARQMLLAGIGTPILLMLVLSMMVVPLPPFALDMLFTFNITFDWWCCCGRP